MLSLHLLLEMFAFVIAALIATVTWHTFSSGGDRKLPLLIGGFVVVGICDVVHALTYDGMPALLGPTSTTRAIFFWLMGRSVEALTLMMIALGWMSRLSRNGSLLAGLLLAMGLVTWGSTGVAGFPVTFIPGQGVTPFKVGYEWALCLLNIGIAVLLWRRWRSEGEPRYLLLACSAWVIGIGELSFSNYVRPSDLQNVVGHGYKLVGYALLYWATYIGSLRAPFEALQQAEQRSTDNEQRMRALADNLPDTVVYQLVRERDGSTRFNHISAAIERVTGVSAAAALADPAALYGRIHPADQLLVRAAEQESAARLQPFDVTVRMRRTDGMERWMHLMSMPRWLPGERMCWDGVQTDVTDSRMAMLQLREQEAMLSAVIDSASDAIISCDPTGRVRLFNPAAERIFGHPAAAMLGQTLDRLLPTPARAHHAEGMARFAAAGVPSRSMGPGRVQGLRADGSELELEASISQVTVNKTQVLTAILRDVTERVRTERSLLRYQTELTELTHQLIAQEKASNTRLAQILHDQLGQTLTAMRIDFVSDPKLATPAESARHARVDRLIDQAIREVRQVLVELRPTLLAEQGLVDAIDNELRSRRQQAGQVRLLLEVAPALAGRRWRSEVEYAVFMVAREAVANALLHASGSEICVRLEGGVRWLRLEVADDGVGLRGEASATRPGHLGLVGMRERSIAIGGQFEVGSMPGGGTVVTLQWEETQA
ncbi:PAS domain S-box protein [Pelomonas sp. V22]|uniref:MASE3 domain-containing protein n=1 Tax=Pelomonas sp. V22 TaxID=2822139 RepID=UPI0024A9F12C|nr:MASE3 domain-containing protein [Pelomonas sp. V22]MDI4635911.1 PAS domain S-box protein [Pelomonas sp. V22]